MMSIFHFRKIVHKTIDQLLFSTGRTNFVYAAEKLLEKSADFALGFRCTCQWNKIASGKQEKYCTVQYNHNNAPPRQSSAVIKHHNKAYSCKKGTDQLTVYNRKYRVLNLACSQNP